MPRGNPRRHVKSSDRLNPHTTFAVEDKGVIDVHYASLTSRPLGRLSS